MRVDIWSDLLSNQQLYHDLHKDLEKELEGEISTRLGYSRYSRTVDEGMNSFLF